MYNRNNSANASSAYLTSGYSTPQSAYQSSQSVYGSTGLSNSSGYVLCFNYLLTT